MNRSAVLIAVALLVLNPFQAGAFQEIGWPDLTVPIAPEDDPYYSLTFEQRLNVETVITTDRKRKKNEPVSDDDLEAEEAAIDRLAKDAISVDAILQKNARFLDKLKLQRTTVRREWDNQEIRIPGYVLPLGFDGMKVTEFLLVPFVGACIHTPPPPANQIVLVKPDASFEVQGLFTPVWVSGRLSVQSSRQNVGLSDGTSDFDVGYSLTASRVEIYRY